MRKKLRKMFRAATTADHKLSAAGRTLPAILFPNQNESCGALDRPAWLGSLNCLPKPLEYNTLLDLDLFLSEQLLRMDFPNDMAVPRVPRA